MGGDLLASPLLSLQGQEANASKSQTPLFTRGLCPPLPQGWPGAVVCGCPVCEHVTEDSSILTTDLDNKA